jgi:ABC-type phosphate transport system permease subunit
MQYVAEAATKFVAPFPTVVYGVIAISIFLLLGFVTWSYRDVANRHENKSSDSKGHH